MIKYEYKVVYAAEKPDLTEEDLNTLGEQGWDLCAQDLLLSGIKYIFKRIKE